MDLFHFAQPAGPTEYVDRQESLLLPILCFVGALACCEAIRRWALRIALVDKPNERSLHTTPKPRLGGVAILLCTGAAGFVSLRGELNLTPVLSIGMLIATVGLIDDVRPLSAAPRLLLQFGAATLFLTIHPVTRLLLAPGVEIVASRFYLGACITAWIVGLLNIYNFMDGMDGLAGIQLIAATIGQGALFSSSGSISPTLFTCILGSSGAGFLMHNFPPARIFLGDAGSTFIGFVLATLAILGMDLGISLAEMALPLAPFLLDGTFTLVRRVIRGEKIWQAHRSHLYQRAVQTGLDHRDVLLTYACWMATALIAGRLTPRTLRGSLAAWTAASAALLAIWLWVVRRELQQARRS